MIPLRDANPTRRTPVITLALIIACFVAFGWSCSSLAAGGEDALDRLLRAVGRRAGRHHGRARGRRQLSRSRSSACSPACSCTAAGSTCWATCCSCGSSATTSRTAWAGSLFLLFYLVGGIAAAPTQVAHRPDLHGAARSGRRARSRRRWARTSCCSRGARIQSLVFLGFFYQLIAVPAVIVLGLLVRAPADRRARRRSAPRRRPRAASPSSPTSAGSSLGVARRPRRSAVRRPPVRRADDAGAMADRSPHDRPEIEMVVESVRVHMLSERHVRDPQGDRPRPATCRSGSASGRRTRSR